MQFQKIEKLKITKPFKNKITSASSKEKRIKKII